jgi:hypothetical protein
MIEIYPDTKVYIVAPAATSTGGPELLHQLAHHLINDLNIRAYMYYIPSTHSNPIHPAYEDYKVPFVREIEDEENNLLIVPEVHMGISLLEHFPNIRNAIWWLSVDNFYLSIVFRSKLNFFPQRMINKIWRKLFKFELFDTTSLALKSKKFESFELSNFVKKADYHFVQSFYALNFIKNKGINPEKIYYLSDYLNKNFLNIQTDLSKKENIVAYNPKKGLYFTKKIIKSAKDIKFVPLINMSREEVIKTLQRAKVYIDFGNHPGKDRIPREAAILGCCVITGKRGSAAFFEDVPIPDEYKFEDKKENIPKIVEKIKDCFENFEERYKDFDYYRQVIKNEPQKFIEDLKKIFVRV